jgi:hypothetical protein
LNLGLHACKEGALLLELCLQTRVSLLNGGIRNSDELFPTEAVTTHENYTKESLEIILRAYGK